MPTDNEIEAAANTAANTVNAAYAHAGATGDVADARIKQVDKLLELLGSAD